MTDETPGTVPAATVCPEDGCHVLVPDTLEDRREHRRGHEHDAKVEDAIRRALRELRADFDTLRGGVRDEVKTIRDEVAGIDRAVGQIEIPEQQPPLEIRRGGWDDDEDDGFEDGSGVDDEDWGFAKPDPDPHLDDEGDEESLADTVALEPEDLPRTPTPADARPAWTRA